MAGASEGDHVHEPHEGTEQQYEDEHCDQVEEEEPGDPAEGSYEARHAHQEHHHAKNDEWPLQNLEAGVVRLGRQPDSGADDGHRKKHRHQVYAADYVFVECHILFGFGEGV